MTDNRNSAQRISILIRKALQQPEQTATARVWVEVLGLDSRAAEDIVTTNSSVETLNDKEGDSKMLIIWRRFNKAASNVVTLDRFAIAFTTA